MPTDPEFTGQYRFDLSRTGAPDQSFVVTTADVMAALDSASNGAIAEGAIGAGTGMQLFDYKGEIGT
ncbi:MAG TPA: P1 family peptidase [Microbacteriaceae bacterium]